jgi:hypothetical protein
MVIAAGSGVGGTAGTTVVGGLVVVGGGGSAVVGGGTDVGGRVRGAVVEVDVGGPDVVSVVGTIRVVGGPDAGGTDVVEVVGRGAPVRSRDRPS